MADVTDRDNFVRAVVQDAVYDARNAGTTITEAAIAASETLSPLIYSDVTVWDGPLEQVPARDGEPAYERKSARRLTWKEAYERSAAQGRADRERLQPYETFVRDLDRCRHGRHEGDDCWECKGPSEGNMWMQDLLEREGETDDRDASMPRLGLGHSLDGRWSYFLRRPPKRGDSPIARLRVQRDEDRKIVGVEITELTDGR